MPGTRDERVSELLKRWQECSQQGNTLTVEELCRENPELCEEIRQRITVEGASLSTPAHSQETQGERFVPPARRLPEVPGYQVQGELGHGGMGIVYLARQVRADRLVALKMIRGTLASSGPAADRFRREVQALARMQHAHIVPIYEVNEHAGQPYFSMEHLPGGNLSQKLAQGLLPSGQAAELVLVLARAVEAAHQAGIIHRDLKPSNVLFTADGVAKIADFGLAKPLDGDPTETPSGAIVGTPCYMAPEQASGSRDVTPATDVYGLGAILYECLTGRSPFRARSVADTILDVLARPVTPPSQSQRIIPAGIEAICLKCLEKKPEKRYATAAELADDLQRWVEGRPIRARIPGPWARVWEAVRRRPLVVLLVVLLLCGVGGGAVLFWNSPSQHLRRTQAALRAGQEVTLLGEIGPPRWFTVQAADPAIGITRDRRELFTVRTTPPALIELIPEIPLEEYRLEASVRHSDGNLVSRVGLYFGHRKFATPGGDEHYFFELAFDDHNPLGQERTPAVLHLLRYSENPQVTNRAPRLALPLKGGHPPGPRLRGQQPWHRLAVEVTAEGIRAWEDERDCGQVRWDTVNNLCKFWLPRNGHAGVELPETTRGSGLGLFVLCGTAEFKTVQARPLRKP